MSNGIFLKEGRALRNVIETSYLCRGLAAAWRWICVQWNESRIRTALTTERKGRAVSQGSVFTKVWEALHRLIVRIFAALKFNKALEGSVFRRTFFWFVLAAAFAPILPTMAVIALAAVAIISVFLCFGCEQDRKLYYSPVNKFIYLYALAYFVATIFSAVGRESLYGGALMVVFALFAVIAMNAVKDKNQLEKGVRIMVWGGFVVAAYGCYQYVFGAS